MSTARFRRTLWTVAAFLVVGIFISSAIAMAGMVSTDHLRSKSSINTNQANAIKDELMLKDGGSLVTGKFVIERRGKGLIHYLRRMIQRIAINNGTAHGNNYDKDGNLIQTQMNLKMTAAITEALQPFGIQIVQHGVTGTPIKDLPALRAIGIRAAHVGTNWQNIIWETLVEAAKTDALAKSIVNRMIEATIAKTPDVEKKYKVSARSEEAKDSVYVLGKDKNLDKLLGKELKNILGDFNAELVALPADLIEKIDAATEKSAIEHMLGFGSDGTAQMVKDYYKANGLTYPEDFSSLKGYFVFKALEGTDKAIMCCNIRSPLSRRGIIRAAKKTGSIVIFQQAMSELDYTWAGGYSPENAVKFAKDSKDAAIAEDFHDYMNKGDHLTVKVDDAFLKDQAAQDSVAVLFEKILEEENISKREAMFNAALKDEALNSAPGVAKAMKAVNKAMTLVKKEVASDFTVFALDASFMPTRLNVVVSAFLAGFIPEDAGLEAEVGEIGGKENSTVADAIEFITGIRYKEEVITDRQGVKYSQLVGPTKVGVVTGGGPASGHNNVLAAMVREGLKKGMEIIALPEGFAGLTKDELAAQARVITLADVEKWEKKGGTFIKTSRTNPYKKEGDAQKVWENIQKLNLDALVTLGGDDTNGVTAKLQKEHPDFLFIGLPKTMDNDVALPEPDAQTYGFDSFTVAASAAFEAGKIDAQSTSRILIAEVFGRSAGFVAARIGANIGATRTLIPEELVDLAKLVDDLRAFYNKKDASGKKNAYGVVVVAEGASVSVDGFKLNDNGELEVLKPDDTNVKLLLAAFKSDPMAKAAFIKSMKATEDNFGHKKLENVGLIVAAVVKAALKEDKIDISAAGKADYLFRSADTSKLDLEMTAMLGKAAVEKIADIQNNQLLYAYKGQIKSIPFAQELGGRVLDYKGAHRDEYLLANLALIDEKTQITIPIAATAEALFEDVKTKFNNLNAGELLSLSLEEMKAVLSKLNIVVESGDNLELVQTIRRIANYMDENQTAQMKQLATMGVFGKINTLDKLEIISAPINELGYAANGLIYRAGAHGGFYRGWEREVNMAALKSMKGPKEADAEEFVRMNSRMGGPFTPYKIPGMRVLKDEKRVIDGVTVKFIFIPADKNIGRPDIRLPYFGPETTTQQVLDTMKKLGTPADVAAYYGPTSDTVQPRIFQELIDAGIPIAAASPVNTDAVKAMFKERFRKQGIAEDQLDMMVSNAFKEGLYSATRKQVGPDVWVVDTLSCTSNAMISVIKAMWDNFGIDHGTGLTIHSETDSNKPFPGKTGRSRDPLDILRGDSIRDDIQPASTGAAKNLFKMIPDLKGKFLITAYRVDTISASVWTTTMDLKKESTVEEVRAMLKDFAENKTDDVVKFWEGEEDINMSPLDSNAVVGWNNVSIIDSFLITMLDNKKTVTISGLYDNQNAAPEQIVGKWAPWMVDGRRMRKLVEKFGDKSAQQDGGSFKAVVDTMDKNMFDKMSAGFDNFAGSLKAVKSVKAGIIVSARTIIDNAGTAETLRQVKQANPDISIVIWADNKSQSDRIKAIGLEDIASIEIKQLKNVLSGLYGQGISKERIVLIHATGSYALPRFLSVEEAGLLRQEKIKLVTLRYAIGGSVNSMPLVVAKAAASVMADQAPVVESYKKMTQNYLESKKISQEDLDSLNDLASEISAVPLVKVSDEVSKIQVAYEETVSKI
jgi:6-phosphofructokinase/fructose/tagatose bisphosphate aldolase